MIDVTDKTPDWQVQVYMAGTKLAADSDTAAPAYNLAGMLYVSSQEGKPWGLLSVPNALVRGVFDAMQEPGIELPPGPTPAAALNAHISVFNPDDIDMLGGAEKLRNDRGKTFRYTLGRLVEVAPNGWADIAKCWVLRVHSPELQALRRSYGLASLPGDGQLDFHVAVAVRRRGVLGRNEKAKDTAAA